MKWRIPKARVSEGKRVLGKEGERVREIDNDNVVRENERRRKRNNEKKERKKETEREKREGERKKRET